MSYLLYHYISGGVENAKKKAKYLNRGDGGEIKLISNL